MPCEESRHPDYLCGLGDVEPDPPGTGIGVFSGRTSTAMVRLDRERYPGKPRRLSRSGAILAATAALSNDRSERPRRSIAGQPAPFAGILSRAWHAGLGVQCALVRLGLLQMGDERAVRAAVLEYHTLGAQAFCLFSVWQG